MKVSIRKISENTGFSPATVSNALNYKKGVNPETAEIIRKEAQKLGYQADAKIKKIRFVIFRRNGKIIDDSPFHPSVIEGVERQAKSMGYETVFCHLNLEKESFREEVEEILSDKESGIVLLGTEMLEEDLEIFEKDKKRIILLDGWSDLHFFNSVLISNTDSAVSAVNYLVEKGHRRIGYLGGDFRIQAFRYREIGYRRALEAHSIDYDESLCLRVGCSLEMAYADMLEYLHTKPQLPTAFFADNDIIAIGAMRALKEEGYKIPEDISIIGFDNISFGVLSNPALTTMHVYKQEMGETAVRELAFSIENEEAPRLKIQVCTKFVERDSVRDLNK